MTALARRWLRAATLALAVLAAFAGSAQASPLLWKVQGAHATVYLFGTVHILKPGLAWRSPAIDGALKASDALWLEIPDGDDPVVAQPFVRRYGTDQAHPLSTRMDPATKAQFDALLVPLGIPAAQMEPLRPWMAGLILSTAPLLKAGYDLNNGVEHVIKAEMQAAGKPVGGFETAEGQMRLLADAPPDLEMEFFRSSVAEGQRVVPMVDDLVAAWADGDELKLEALSQGEFRDKYPRVYKLMLTDRNRRFAEKIAILLKGKGVSFVAVGAAHLTGADSVQAQLARRGMTAVRQ